MRPSLLPAALALAAIVPSARVSAQASPDFAAADVQFMSGMIHHHSQAVLIAGWAPTHGASAPLLTLCSRIIVSQNDEIALMQSWLRDHHQPVPAASPPHDTMAGMNPAAMMPGMLTAAQLSQLDHARGTDFDQLFLTYMIQHHNGAITMVNLLFAQGAGEEPSVFRLASGIYADQTTEIARMQKMLVAIMFGPPAQ